MLNPKIKEAIAHLDPNGDFGEGVARLYKEKIFRDTVKYELMIKNFKKKYKMDYHSFKEKVKNEDVTFEEEQDFFDWDMAITAIQDLKRIVSDYHNTNT